MTKTGAINSGVGAKLNKAGRPTIYLEKRFPIEGRKDFFKWVIVTPTGLAKDWQGKDMYFDEFDLWRAKEVLKAKRRVEVMNQRHLK